MKGKYLITTDNWFYAPDGLQYRCAWGNVEILGDDILGIKTNQKSSNWFAKVGSDNKHVIIAGCQIHYAVRRENKPTAESVNDFTVEGGVVMKHNKPVHIYIAE